MTLIFKSEKNEFRALICTVRIRIYPLVNMANTDNYVDLPPINSKGHTPE